MNDMACPSRGLSPDELGAGRHPGSGQAVSQAALCAALGGDAVCGRPLSDGIRALEEEGRRALDLHGQGLPLQLGIAGGGGRCTSACASWQGTVETARRWCRNDIRVERRLRLALRGCECAPRQRRCGFRGAVLSLNSGRPGRTGARPSRRVPLPEGSQAVATGLCAGTSRSESSSEVARCGTGEKNGSG